MRWTPPDEPPELSAEQRRRLFTLLQQELRASYLAALAAGADPAQLDADIDERRRSLAADGSNTAADDPAAGTDRQATGADQAPGTDEDGPDINGSRAPDRP
jgi:hypothetical protein